MHIVRSIAPIQDRKFRADQKKILVVINFKLYEAGSHDLKHQRGEGASKPPTINVTKDALTLARIRPIS